MSELGSGNGSSYPGAIDTDSIQEVNSPNAGKTKARAEVPNDHAAALVAIQTELGTDPAGTKTNVKTFLQVEHGADGTHAVVTATSIATASLVVNGQVQWAKGGDVASASALTLGTDGNYFDITGTTTVTSIDTLGVGIIVKLHFDAALILTHHATDLILPSAANITTAAGDESEFVEYATGDWRCVNYSRADGTPLILGQATAADLTITGSAASPPDTNTLTKENIVKAWTNIDGSGVIAANDDFNVSGYTDNGVGDYTATWDTDFANASYAVAATSGSPQCRIFTIATGSVRIKNSTSDGTASDSASSCIIAIGGQ